MCTVISFHCVCPFLLISESTFIHQWQTTRWVLQSDNNFSIFKHMCVEKVVSLHSSAATSLSLHKHINPREQYLSSEITLCLAAHYFAPVICIVYHSLIGYMCCIAINFQHIHTLTHRNTRHPHLNGSIYWDLRYSLSQTLVNRWVNCIHKSNHSKYYPLHDDDVILFPLACRHHPQTLSRVSSTSLSSRVLEQQRSVHRVG